MSPPIRPSNGAGTSVPPSSSPQAPEPPRANHDSFVSEARVAFRAAYQRIRHRLFQDSNPILRDRTAEFRQRTAFLTPTGQEILRGFDRGIFPHVILGGPSGVDKDRGVTTAAIAAVRGESGVQAFAGRQVRYVQLNASRVVEKAGSWMNGAHPIFFRALDGLAGENPVIIHITDADRLLRAGMGPGNQPLNLMHDLYPLFEDARYENLHFILDSELHEDIQRRAPDLRRRVTVVEATSLLPQEVALNGMIRNSVPNYDSLPREARLAIADSLPSLRADIMNAWRCQGNYRELGRNETDPITRDFVERFLHSRRASHSWMETHLPRDHHREERRRGR